MEERVAEATRRASMAEDAYEKLSREHSDLHDQHTHAQSSLRDHADRLLMLSSEAEQRGADHSHMESQIRDLSSSHDQHIRTLEQAQAALAASSARTEEIDTQWRRAREQITRLESDAVDLRSELEARTHEAEAASAQLADVENAWAKSREEVDALRALTTGGLGELLDSHRDMKADEDRATRGHAEKVGAMESEVVALRARLQETSSQLDEAQASLNEHRNHTRSAESEQISLRTQLAGLRSQVADSTAQTGRLRLELASKTNEIDQKARYTSQAEVKLGALRNYLADNGMIIDEGGLPVKGSGPAVGRAYELEAQLAEHSRARSDLERELQSAHEQRQEAESQAEVLSSQLERLRSRTPDPATLAAMDSRAADAERKLAEAEQNHHAKVQQVEGDYLAAVRYIKYVKFTMLFEMRLTYFQPLGERKSSFVA